MSWKRSDRRSTLPQPLEGSGMPSSVRPRSSTISVEAKRLLEGFELDATLLPGARNVVVDYLGVTENDHVALVCDAGEEAVGRALVAALDELGATLSVYLLASDVPDQLLDVLGRARVPPIDLARDDRRARLQRRAHEFHGAHDGIDATVQFAAEGQVVGESDRDRADVFDQPPQRTRLVAEVGRIEQGQCDRRLLESPDQRFRGFGHPAVVDHVVEHRRDHVEHGQLRGRRTGQQQDTHDT